MSAKLLILGLTVAAMAGCSPPPVEQAMAAPQPYHIPTPSETGAGSDAQPKTGGSSGAQSSAQTPDPEVPKEKPSKLFTWASTRDDALKLARKTNGIVVLKFEATWCEPCQVMKHEAFNDPVTADLLKKAVIVPIDLDSDMGQALGPEYDVQSIPKLVFLKPDGKKFGQIDGYMTLDGFRGDVDRILKG